MSDETKNKQYVCLDFGGANCTYVEIDEDQLDEEEDINSWFAEMGLAEDGASDWAAERLSIIFDGDLDEPDKFKSIKAIGVYGPDLFEFGDSAPLMSGFAVYLEVQAHNSLSEEELEDIFHLIVPVIKNENVTVGFAEFDDYSVSFEKPDDGVRAINVVWP